DGSVTVCEDGSAINLFTQLGGSPDAGGTWSGPSTITNDQFDPSVNTAGTYIYTLDATPPCTGDQSEVEVTIAPAPYAGTDGDLTVCDQGAAVSLLTALGTPDTGGSWSGPSPVTGDQYDPATMDAGGYTYTVTGTSPCGSASATVTVTETGSPNAGTDGSVTVCEDGSAINLFTQLGGSPDAGGTWSGPSTITNDQFDPTVNTAGTYIYTLDATPPCTGDQSQVVVTIAPAPYAGTDGDLTVCDQGAAVSLLAALGTPDTGGSWSGPSPVTGDQYDPATMAPGDYTYTVTGTAPCGSASATVTVSETGSPNAGTDGSVTVCEDGSAINLFTQLGGSPDAGGTWSGPSTITNDQFDPVVNTAGIYTYTLSATPPCVDATAEVEVVIEAPQDPGINALDTVCTGDAPVNLFTLLGGNPDQGGTWTGPGGTSTGIFDPATSTQGVYTYQFIGGVCADVSATVQMIVLPGPNAGQDNAVALCDAGPVVNLHGLLSGNPQQGGTWIGPDGLATSASMNPATAEEGPYTYTVTGNASCPDASAVVSLSINHAVDAGTNGALSVCSDGAPVALFGELGGAPDAGGTWTMPPNNDPFNGILDPSTNSSGTYIYTVQGASPCPSASAEVVVVVVQAPDAGNDTTAALCSINPPVNMLNLLGGEPDAGGSWTDPDGNATSATFDPSSSIPGAYSYLMPAVASCAQAVATVDISVSPAAYAGIDGDTTVCANAESFQLFNLLSGTPDVGGTWSGPAGISADGILDPTAAISGSYIYTVTAPAPCQQDIASVEVTVTPIPDVAPNFEMSEGCVPVQVTFTSGYAGDGTCYWNFGNGMDTTDCGPITITYDQPGNYVVHFTADPGNGCAVTTEVDQLVRVVERPVAAFSIVGRITSTTSPTAAFANGSTGASAYLWDFGGMGTSTLANPQFTFPYNVEEIYPICLIAYASPTCSDTICEDLLVPASASVFTANAFTPDGDGINDEFAPVVMGLDPNDYHFIIVDRWGKEVYNTEDMNAKWDGNFSNGNPAPIGVYVWKLTGQDMVANTRFEHIGHVTLVR
ncbi:MAG: gliding motility-associated C-terminal domain-containing protein, partial [Flavobacteriales bacterium]